MTPAELAADLRTRINPKYANQKGCESYLNRGCAEAIESLLAENERLRDVMRKLLANADWRVGGALTPTSKRSDFQSSGYSIVKTRDLASVRDALGE